MKQLESKPSSGQRFRLSQWLERVQDACQEFGIFLETEDGELTINDGLHGTVIGVGLVMLTDDNPPAPPTVTALDCSGSILDGAWLVDSPEGLREQCADPTWRPS
jgi:hypothetical protein